MDESVKKQISENLSAIRYNIAEAADKSGRTQGDVTLVCVTKTIDVERINYAVSLGLDDLGENRVQEFMSKQNAVTGVRGVTVNTGTTGVNGIRWHLIGHLQTNKVRNVVGQVALIHSVDSLRLAEEINNRAGIMQKKCDILIEVNIAGEYTKDGVSPSLLPDLVKSIGFMEHVRIKGLMTVAPYADSGEKNRNYFKHMYQLLVDINGKSYDNVNMQILSMGMTADYVTAIEEGANVVRIGTGLFGCR